MENRVAAAHETSDSGHNSRMLRPGFVMSSQAEPGAKRLIDGQWRVYYDGYWIKVYDPPADTLLAKKRLIEALTRRLFNHVEHGLNIPGTRLEEARRAYVCETDLPKKRVKGAAAHALGKFSSCTGLGIQTGGKA